MFPANSSTLNKSDIKSRGDECVLAAVSISIPVLGESLQRGGEDSPRILILQCKKLNLHAGVSFMLLMLHLPVRF